MNGVEFSTIDEAQFITNNEDKFSILNQIHSCNRISNEKFEFMLEYDGGRYIVWKQTNSPLDEEEDLSCSTKGQCFVEGFEHIRSNMNDDAFGGLAKKKRLSNGCIPTLIAGTLFNNQWFYVIGMTSQCYTGWDHSTIPASYGKTTLAVSLWMRVPFLRICSCRKRDCSSLTNNVFLLLASVS
jgi:hypothetical protein